MGRSCRGTWSATIAPVLLPALAFYLHMSTHVETGRPKQSQRHLQERHRRLVPEDHWDPDQEGGCAFAASIAAMGRPVVFRDCEAVRHWSALHWSAHTLAQMNPRLPVQVQWSEQGYFMFVDQDQEAQGLLEDTARGSAFDYSTAQVPLESFVRNMSRPGYHRLTGLMSANGSMSSFLPGVRPFSSLTVPMDGDSCAGDVFAARKPDATDPTVISFWLASAGTTTHTHYDVDHNFFVQLSGTKTFTLFSPEDSDRLYFFPEAHPRARKSQVRLRANESDLHRAFSMQSEVGAAAQELPHLRDKELAYRKERERNHLLFPRFSQAERWAVTLGAGDVLFVPPFWPHHVHYETEGLSVSVFSPSRQTTVLDDLQATPLPFEAEWTLTTQALGLELLVALVVEHLQGLRSIAERGKSESCLTGDHSYNWPPHGDTAASVLWARLLATRYADRIAMAPADQAVPAVVEALSACPDLRLHKSNPFGASRSPTLLAKFSARAKEISALIWQQDFPGLQAQTLEWWMEMLVMNFVGARNIRPFVQHCVPLLPPGYELWERQA